MAVRSRTEEIVKAALRAAEEADATPAEKAEMLMELAMGLQQKPQSVEDLEAAVGLYETALDLCPADLELFEARVRARLATALMAIPSPVSDNTERARESLEAALKVLGAKGADEEIAEAEMNLGLALQNLAGIGKARIQDAIGAYQRALRTFDKTRHPKEFAILQNNLATAFLSIPITDETSRMREALAVQAFEEGLAVVNLIDHPSEYAMLQNNLGNALQYVSSSHTFENNLRALDAYDEALKVRTSRDTPGEYANTIANKANCLINLADDPADPGAGNPNNCAEAAALYREAMGIFDRLGEADKSAAVAAAIAELSEAEPQPRRANGSG
jgi:tetratricopeptide (TPR) repeat protein